MEVRDVVASEESMEVRMPRQGWRARLHELSRRLHRRLVLVRARVTSTEARVVVRFVS